MCAGTARVLVPVAEHAQVAHGLRLAARAQMGAHLVDVPLDGRGGCLGRSHVVEREARARRDTVAVQVGRLPPGMRILERRALAGKLGQGRLSQRVTLPLRQPFGGPLADQRVPAPPGAGARGRPQEYDEQYPDQHEFQQLLVSFPVSLRTRARCFPSLLRIRWWLLWRAGASPLTQMSGAGPTRLAAADTIRGEPHEDSGCCTWKGTKPLPEGRLAELRTHRVTLKRSRSTRRGSRSRPLRPHTFTPVRPVRRTLPSSRCSRTRGAPCCRIPS